MNIAQAFVRDPSIVEFVVEQGVKFVTTSAGSPTKYTSRLKDAGLTVFHVVPNLHGALKAVDAGDHRRNGTATRGREVDSNVTPTPESRLDCGAAPAGRRPRNVSNRDRPQVLHDSHQCVSSLS